MDILQKSQSHIEEVISYTPPRLHEGKDWYIDFYAYDPAKNKKHTDCLVKL